MEYFPLFRLSESPSKKMGTYYFIFRLDIDWLDESQKENIAHLLASMHSSIIENDETKSAHLNNLSYTKFIEKFNNFLLKKYSEIETSHKNVCRLLEHIQRQHSTAKKLLVQLQQENMVLEERIQSTDKMLQQIGQDMTMTEHQLKVHNMQTKKTVQLKRILPEFQSAHERNVYKTVAIVANTKKLIQNINMNSLQELRGVSKPSGRVEDILASVIIILKSPTADVTWQKGAKRQMANLDRFLDELQTFDEHEIMENTIKLLADLDKKIVGTQESQEELNSPYYQALSSLHQWTKGVLKYHSLMIHHVRPLHKKCEEIEKEVKEADQKLTSLDRKSEALNNRLRDLAENFEEATVDKEEQHEKVVKMKQQLQTASELNIVITKLIRTQMSQKKAKSYFPFIYVFNIFPVTFWCSTDQQANQEFSISITLNCGLSQNLLILKILHSVVGINSVIIEFLVGLVLILKIDFQFKSLSIF